MNNTFLKHHWRCTGCGAEFLAPEYCKECGNAHCPECKRSNSLMNVREMERLVSNDIPNGKPKRSTPSKPRSKKDIQSRIQQLIASTSEE